MYMCVYIYTYIYTHTHTHTYIYIYTYIFIYHPPQTRVRELERLRERDQLSHKLELEEAMLSVMSLQEKYKVSQAARLESKTAGDELLSRANLAQRQVAEALAALAEEKVMRVNTQNLVAIYVCVFLCVFLLVSVFVSVSVSVSASGSARAGEGGACQRAR